MVSTGRNRSMIDVAGRYKTEKSARQAVVDLERLWSRHTPEGMTTEFLVDTPEHEERR